MSENLKPHRPFKLVEYDSHWINEFEKRRGQLLDILGDMILDVQHIGSTSIPGMAAKPQVDILVVVKNLGEVREKYDAMRASSFIARGDYSHIGEEYFTEDDKEGTRLSGIHVFPLGHPEIEKAVQFRNYLRAHEEERDLYAKAKKELFKKYADNYAAYDSGKGEIIRAMQERAKRWAHRV